MNVDWKEISATWTYSSKEWARRAKKKHSLTYILYRKDLFVRCLFLHTMYEQMGLDCSEVHRIKKQYWRELFSIERKRWKEREVGK